MLSTMLAATSSTASSLSAVMVSMAIALVTGLLISWLYIKTNPQNYSQSLAITLVFMPAVISTIIMLVGENIATAFSLAGIFTIIRFRSAPGSAKDILLILFGVGAGLAYGVQLYLYGIIFAIVMAAVQFALYKANYGISSNEKLRLKIVAPDTSNNEAIFAKILSKHTASYQLDKIGTRDLGSVYELVYIIEMSKDQDRKALIDELRRHNGNLNISLNNGAVEHAF